MNTRLPNIAIAALLISCCAASAPASAQSADIRTIVSVGGPPVVLQQNSQLNMAGVFEVGSSTSATVVQNGHNNYVGILQFGGIASASGPFLAQKVDVPTLELPARRSRRSRSDRHPGIPDEDRCCRGVGMKILTVAGWPAHPALSSSAGKRGLRKSG